MVISENPLTFPEGPAVKILSRREVSRIIGAGVVSLWRWERAGHFPARIQIGPRRVGWRQDEIEAWIASRKPAAGGGER
ncbi:MAG: AlpA family phage regulatory protein [Nitrospinae bacterium]|nr:AlpA family phage regulatory protein [Nitrospinota bacterium]